MGKYWTTRTERRTRHSQVRCRQRGVSEQELCILLDHCDHLVSVGRGCTAMTMSHRVASELHAEGAPGAYVERARRRAAIIAPDGALMTVLVAVGRRGRRYRRGRTGRSWT